MGKGKFARGVAITLAGHSLGLLLGVGTSVILARVLGPEGNGIYALALLLPSLIVTFGNLGIGSATIYYVARGDFQRQEILGNNVLLSLGISGIGVLTGLVVIFFFGETLFPSVSSGYLLLALTLVPVEIFFSHVNYILLGAQRIKEFNYVQIVQPTVFLAFVTLALVELKVGVAGAILARLISWLIADALIFRLAKAISTGIDLNLSSSYMKRTITYGIQAHVANILGFLNYRVDMFLVNWFLGPAVVGLYAAGVGLVEKLWMVSQAASTVLLPQVAAETEEERRKEFTPLVARTVLWTTTIGAVVLAIFSRWIVILLYSKAFLPAVGALQALLIGAVALSAGRVLANDIAGRGYPGWNIYTGFVAVIINIALNFLWIPRYGIVGAAWASTVSYTLSFFCIVFLYCRLSGNGWTAVIFPQRSDWILYCRMASTLLRGY